MKPTWGIRKLNEYSVDKNTAIIVTDSDKDSYYWADIPDGSLLVNEKTGNLSIKLTGESDWVPFGIRKDGTDKLVKDAVINIEYYTIVKFEPEHNRFYYHDREEITRIGKLIDGKAQFKVGSGLYIPGLNQLEVYINDAVRRNTIDGGLEEINMKYFQIDEDDIRLHSTVTVRYINYERLSEVYPFIYTQETYPWFFEDKDLWINTSDKTGEYGLVSTPLSYSVEYPNDDIKHAIVHVFTTKKSHLIAAYRREEYFNGRTANNITSIKVPRKSNDYFLNLFSTYPGYRTQHIKVLIKGIDNKSDKLTIDANVEYINNTRAKAIVKTQLGNIVTLKRNNKTLHSSQNLSGSVIVGLPREEQDYQITAIVRNPKTKKTKEAIVTIQKRKLVLFGTIDHSTDINGTKVIINTLKNAQIKVEVSEDGVKTGTITLTANEDGYAETTVPLSHKKQTISVTITHPNADGKVTDQFDVLLHKPLSPLAVEVKNGEKPGDRDLIATAEEGSTIYIYDSNGKLLLEKAPAKNGNRERAVYAIPLFYKPETRTYTVKALAENKIPEQKDITVEGYEKINAPANSFDVNEVTINKLKRWDVAFKSIADATIKAETITGQLIKTILDKDAIKIDQARTVFTNAGQEYQIKQKRIEQKIKFIWTHPLYKNQEIIRTVPLNDMKEFTIEVSDADTYVLNAYANLYDSKAYQVLLVDIYRNPDDGDPIKIEEGASIKINDKLITVINREIPESEFELLKGSPESYKHFYGSDDLREVRKITIDKNKIDKYLDTAYKVGSKHLLVFEVSDFEDLLHDREQAFKVNNRVDITTNIKTVIAHYTNLYDLLIDNTDEAEKKEYRTIYDKMEEANSRGNINWNYPSKMQEFKVFSRHVKYIHPELKSLLTIYDYDSTKSNKLQKIAETIKSSTEFANMNYSTDLNRNNEMYYGILYGDTRISVKKKIYLYPSVFTERNYFLTYYKNDSIRISMGYLKNYIKNSFKFSKNDLDINKSILKIYKKDVKTNLFDFLKAKNYNVLKEDNVDTNKFSAINIELISTDTTTIPSLFHVTPDHTAQNCIYYFPALEEAKQFALSINNYDVELYFNYPNLKRFNEMAFYVPFDLWNGVKCKNLSKNKEIQYPNVTPIIFNDGDKYYNHEVPYNPKKADLDILPLRCPFPSNRSTPFILNVNGKKRDVGIPANFINSSATESVKWNCYSVTIVDKDGDPFDRDMMLRKDTWPSKDITQFINNEFKIVRYNNSYINFSSEPKRSWPQFNAMSKVKNLDLSIITNLYVGPGDFQSMTGNLTLPSKYIIREFPQFEGLMNYRWYDRCGMFTSFGGTHIHNLDNLMSSLLCIHLEMFKNVKNLVTPINFNYIRVIGDLAFEDSNIANFILKKRPVNIDHMGNVQTNRGRLEDAEKNIYNYTIAFNNSIYGDYSNAFKNATKITQNSFNTIAPYIERFPAGLFQSSSKIKEVVLRNENLKVFRYPLYNLNKLVIESNSCKIIALRDIVFNDTEILKSEDNYKINCPNAQVLSGENKGLYSTFFSIKTAPNNQMASYRKFLHKESDYYYEPGLYHYINYSPKAIKLIDYGGNTPDQYCSFFNKEETANVIKQKVLHIDYWNLHSFLFDKDVNLDDIQIEELHFWNKKPLKAFQVKTDEVNVANKSETVKTYSTIRNHIDYSNRVNYVRDIRWPKLKKIFIHNYAYSLGTSGQTSQTFDILGVEFTYVRD